jgi:hypothetical protein
MSNYYFEFAAIAFALMGQHVQETEALRIAQQECLKKDIPIIEIAKARSLVQEKLTKGFA